MKFTAEFNRRRKYATGMRIHNSLGNVDFGERAHVVLVARVLAAPMEGADGGHPHECEHGRSVLIDIETRASFDRTSQSLKRRSNLLSRAV